MEAVAVNPVIKVAALCGSLRKGSFNRGLLRSAIQLSKESVNGMEIEYIDISPLPMLNTDLEKILQADSVLFASPEYNFSVTDHELLADKAAAIVSTGGSFGGGRAQYHLRQIGVYLDLHFINKPEFYLNAFAPPAKFDSDGNLIDPPSKEKLKEVLLSLLAFTLRLKGQ
ncbi:NADPH:QUINONE OXIDOREDUCTASE family protein [Salix suchowensis]|nr:NADPH:QUINONE OXIDOREDUCTASE family protein [Salix suchowensis]